MIRNFFSIAAIVVFLSCAQNAQAAKKWLHSSEFGRMQIILNPNPTLSEEKAAEWFQRHWHTMTGNLIPILSKPDPTKVTVWLGPNDNPFFEQSDLIALGNDGFVIETISKSNQANMNGTREDRHLILAGGRQRGTLYAVWHFFEKIMGMRWLAPDSFHVPLPPNEIPTMKVRKIPDFWYRDISYRAFAETPWLNAAGKTNGFYSGTPKDWGGHIRYLRGLEGHGHTFHYFIPPEEYFDDHPEYFAEIDGIRRADGQLCLTNPDVLAITIQKVDQLLDERDENEKIISVSQMDFFQYDSWCTCSNCEMIDQEEESQAGTIIRFVNEVARAIRTDHPEVLVDTFAYQYSRRPPAHTVPEDNVIVRLCDFECDFSRPLDDPTIPENRAFLADLKQWGRITKNLFIWDYTQNWYSHQGPHPNIHVLQPNVALFAKYGASGVFEQSSWESPHSDFEFLKEYILAHSLWEPRGDWKIWYKEFLTYYYQEAAPYIDEYLNLIHNHTHGEEVFLHLANRMQWMDYDMVVRAQTIFYRAFKEIKNPVLVERLRYAYLPVQYAALVCPPRITATSEAYTFERPPSQSFDEYWDMIMEYGVTRLEDWPIEYFRDRLDGTTPPRKEVHPKTTLTASNFDLEVLPTLGGKITQLESKKKQWLNGFRIPDKSRHCLQLWIADNEQNMAPVETPFSIISNTESELTLQSKIDSTWLVTLTYEFNPSISTLTYEVTLSNETELEQSPKFQIKMELATDSRKRSTIFGAQEEPIRLREKSSVTFNQNSPWHLEDRKHLIGVVPESAATALVNIRDHSHRMATSITWTPILESVPPGSTTHWGMDVKL